MSYTFSAFSSAAVQRPSEVELPRTITIGSYLTPGLINIDGTGMFNKLTDAIFSEINVSYKLSISSIKRVRAGIKDGKLDSYFPELWENLPGDKSQYIVSRPIFYKRIILFTLVDSKLSNLSDFEGKLLGGVEGFSYGKAIKADPNLSILYQKDDITNMRLLLTKRLDGVLGGFPGTVKALKRFKHAGMVQFDLDKPVAVLESFYVCKNDTEGQKLCSEIDKAIESLLRKGVLELNPETGFSRFNPVI